MSGIRTLGELKAALSSVAFAGLVRDIDMPALISSLSWRTHLTQHFQLHCHDDREADHSFGAPFADQFERMYGELATCLSLAPRSKQERLIVKGSLTGFIIRTRSERTFGSMEAPGPLFYLMDSEQDPDFMLHFRHEIAHLMWGRLYGEARRCSMREWLSSPRTCQSRGPRSTRSSISTPRARATCLRLRMLLSTRASGASGNAVPRSIASAVRSPTT